MPWLRIECWTLSSWACNFSVNLAKLVNSRYVQGVTFSVKYSMGYIGKQQICLGYIMGLLFFFVCIIFISLCDTSSVFILDRFDFVQDFNLFIFITVYSLVFMLYLISIYITYVSFIWTCEECLKLLDSSFSGLYA